MDLIQPLPPCVRLFAGEDEEALKKLFVQKPIHVGGVDLIYDRSPGFQNLLRAQGEPAVTWILENRGEVAGCASNSTSMRWVNGSLHPVSYLSDLRVKPSRASSLAWRDFFPQMLDRITAEGRGDYHLTAVLKNNRAGLSALTAPRNRFRYHLLSEPWMVNLFGSYRLSTDSGPVRPVRSGEKDRLLEFLNTQSKKRLFGHQFPAEFERRSRTWPEYSHERFLVYEKGPEWLGVCLPWSPTPLKRMIVSRAPWVLRKSLAALSILGRTPPRLGEALETVYLTHLYSGETLHPADLAASVFGYLRGKGTFRYCHMVSFSAADSTWLPRRALRGLIKQQIPAAVYLVTRLGSPLAMSAAGPLDFEMGLV